MADSGKRQLPRLEIRKYQNRRYYDSTHSQHLSLETIHSMICDGHDISVTDAKSGEDITPKVLAQILLEYEPLKLSLLPNNLLIQIIRAKDSLIGEFMNVYFDQALEAFSHSQKHFKDMLQQSHLLGGGLPDASKMFANPWFNINPMTAMTGAMQAVASDKASRQSTEEEAMRDELAALREEMKELRKNIPATKQRRPKGK